MADTIFGFADEGRLKSELQAARRKGVLKSDSASSRACARCRSELGRIINRGAFCRWCRHRVCKSCRQYLTTDTSDWVCTVCHKHMELTAATGDWMTQFVRRPSKRRDSRITAVETVKRSLQRSWTFSDASPSPWAALRNSPEMRAYSSMPRHQDCEFIARTVFTNQLNLSRTRNNSETIEHEPTPESSDSTEEDKGISSSSVETEEKASDYEQTGEDPVSQPLTQTGEDGPVFPQATQIEDGPVFPPVSQAEDGPVFLPVSQAEDGPVFLPVADDESSIGSPTIEKRSLSESVDQSSVGSPMLGRDSPLGSSGESPLVAKREVGDTVIEPLTGTVFRKVTLKKRRVDTRNLPPGVTPPRSRRHVPPQLETDYYSEDYKLVFISSSDSSSRDSDDEVCEWDYYEPGGGGSVVPHQAASVASTAEQCAVPVPIPVPIPVPVPVLVPVPWTPDLTIRVQHLWSMQQLITVTLDGQMNSRPLLSEDLRLAALKHLQDLAAAAAAAASSQAATPTGPPKGLVESKDSYLQELAATTYPQDLEENKSISTTLPKKVPLSENKDCDNYSVPSDLVSSDNNEVLIDTTNNKSESVVVSDEPRNEQLVESEQVLNSDEYFEQLDNKLSEEVSSEVNGSVDKSLVDGIVLKNYKSLDFSELDVSESNKECVHASMDFGSGSDSSSDDSDSDRSDRGTKRFYKLNGEEEAEEESSDDEESSGEFSMASSLSSSPGSGKFKRVYVVNDSDSDLGELPEYNDDSAQEEGEVTLLSHVTMSEVRLSDILGSLPAVQDSLDDLPESEHEARQSADDKASICDNDEAAPDLLHNMSSDSFIDSLECKIKTEEFLLKETKYCDNDKTVTGGEFVLAKAVGEGEGSDEECAKLSETRGSNTSDEFSGTESMELEQGQVRPAGPVTATGESWRETGRYTSLVMITQEHIEPVSVVTSDTTTLVDGEEEEEVDGDKRYTLTLDTGAGAFSQEPEVRVVTGNGTTAVVILEEGLPDDDSWVEELDRDKDEFATTTEDSSEDDTTAYSTDREEELRGYNPRSAIDFTLHTIVEESCEESEVEERNRPTELEKYFFYGVADGQGDNREVDTMSETSSIHSEGLESLGGYEDGDNDTKDPAELASSRLEKYFLSGLLGCSRRDSDGSVGSDSEGKPSPEQRRKRLVRARGTGRQHSNSLDNLNESEQQDEVQMESEASSTETDSHDDLSNSFEKSDGQFDTVKRTKKKKRSVVSAPSLELLDVSEDPSGSGCREELDSDDGNKTPVQPEFLLPADLSSSRSKQQSRDSGFMGSCDDLLRENKEAPINEVLAEAVVEKVPEVKKPEEPVIPQVKISTPSGLIRKDSFNNWSSDEETNLMMSKMRQFFKTMVASQPKVSSPNVGARSKPPQLVHFESELTRLMKTVPGIRDEQVKEIVEYLSSEDTWSDSYDSSDYTSSDLEGAGKKTALQEEISASCRQIISNFETAGIEEPAGTSKDTAFVYQRLVASFSRLDTPSSDSSASRDHNSPPLIAKVMQHIGSRLVALMHEVSSAEGGSPKAARYHRRLQHKASTTSTTEDEEDLEDYNPLPRSKSHDPLIEENRQEASDNERFSWRGSFESALMASDSRTRLASGGEASVSASALALAAKRRSAGDLLFKTSSREQLDRVRSCGSIGGSVEDKIWGLRHQKRRRSSVPDSGGSNDGDDDSEEEADSGRSTTLPRSLQTSCAATNSLPRLPTSPTSASPSIYKAHSVSVVSARYRPPGYSSRGVAVVPPRRDVTRRRAAQTPSPSLPTVVPDDVSVCSESVSIRAVEEEDRLNTSRSSSLGARSDSLASVYSGAGEGRYGSVAVKGEVEFGLQYNYKQGALEIYVKQCRDLAAVDTKRNRSDPYVKVYLLPDKSKSGKRKTRVKKHTLNPVFEETLKFHITLEALESRTLWLSVWHSDMFGRNDFLGEVTMALENKVFDDPLPKFYTLQERTEPLEELMSSKGELIVGLKFVPPEGRKKGCLQVLVKEAKNLVAVKSNGTSDPFCKSYLLPDKGRSSKQKTAVVRKCVSPAWNHTFNYSGVTLEELATRSLELTIWDHDRLASNEFLGGVRLNLGTGKHGGKSVDWMDASGKETSLWQRMLERPNLWVESCLSLRPSLDVRNNS